jgi:hypothetical protein
VTDRIHALTVVLEDDVREDDVEAIVAAIRMIRRVLSVKAHVADHRLHAAEERVRRQLGDEILRVVFPDWKR